MLREWRKTKVPLTILDDYIDESPTLIKIDIEGYELEALRGATELLKLRPKLAIEVHVDLIKQGGGSADEIFKYVGLHGYEFWIQMGANDEPRRYCGELLGNCHSEQIHLYGFPL